MMVDLHKLYNLQCSNLRWLRETGQEMDARIIERDFSFKSLVDFVNRLKNGKLYDSCTSKERQFIVEYLGNIKSLGLTFEEATCIMYYAGFHSRYINRDYHIGLLENRLSDKVLFERYLSYVLNKIPSYTGMLYRKDLHFFSKPDSTEVISFFKSRVGVRFVVPFFLSTSKHHNGITGLNYRIETLDIASNARDISLLTDKPNEEEVLFNQNSYFIVGKVEVKKRVVHLKETLPAEEINFIMQGKFYK